MIAAANETRSDSGTTAIIDAIDTDGLTVESFTPIQWALLRRACEQSFELFVYVMFRAATGRRWVRAPFQRILFETMTRVYNGEIEQLIINMPPRYGKTWIVVVLWVAWCLVKDPVARFIYTSYSDELIYTSSRFVRSVIACDVYQLLWPLSFRDDSDAKKAWTLQDYGGGLNAAPVNGQLTGFGAGVTGYDGFGGARIVDDPNKVQDAGRDIMRERVKAFYSETFESRKEHRHVPTIVIQQRTDEDDLSGYLLSTGAHGRWSHLIIQALVDPTWEYPHDRFPYGDPINHWLDAGSCWEYKKTVAELEAMRDNPETRHVFHSQYQQDPTPKGNTMVAAEWFRLFDEYNPVTSMVDGVPVLMKRLYLDTAQKTEDKNDFSAMLAAVLGADRNLYLIDLRHGKYEAPALLAESKDFIHSHRFVVNVCNVGLNAVCIEDKSSGTGLIQTINYDNDFIASIGGVTITGIPRNRDKVSRMYGVAPYIEAGRVFVPRNAPWAQKLIREVSSFNRNDTHKHDDITDVVMDAVSEMLIESTVQTIDYSGVRTA